VRWLQVVWTVDRMPFPLRAIRDFVTLDMVHEGTGGSGKGKQCVCVCVRVCVCVCVCVSLFSHKRQWGHAVQLCACVAFVRTHGTCHLDSVPPAMTPTLYYLAARVFCFEAARSLLVPPPHIHALRTTTHPHAHSLAPIPSPRMPIPRPPLQDVSSSSPVLSSIRPNP
jgi:hypothetical protein